MLDLYMMFSYTQDKAAIVRPSMLCRSSYYFTRALSSAENTADSVCGHFREIYVAG